MTSLALVLLAGPAAVCMLVTALSAVYIWSGDAGRRTRAWHVLQALLDSARRGRGGGSR
ncbi:hypothetical protein [Actinacidiphila sp. bgisy144]|uniref:hypothetical protein n=1 Tax=Actinacidiphila sp. bgisy144 TaxID=3413791 RepID=UPI003EBAC137